MKDLIEKSKDIFRKKRKTNVDGRLSDLTAENQRLKDVIPEITQENLELKKRIENYGVRR